MSMQMTQPKGGSNGQKFFHYSCNHCHWSTLNIDFKGENLNNLLIKFNFYKGKYNRSP